MKKFISAASIGQYRNVVKSVCERAGFTGLDEDGKAIYDPSIKKPILTFKGSVKLHGTFSSVCYNEISGVWYQSKKEVITPIPEILYKISFDDETNVIVENEEDKLKFSKNILGIKKLETHDNAGFAWFAESKKQVFIDLIKSLASYSDIDLKENTIMLCMEWCGKGIQKNVGISKLDKSAFIFSQAKVSPFNEEISSYWISTKIN